MKQSTAEILLSSQIPFAMGMSEFWAADCLGLLVLKCKLDDEPFDWEPNIPRKVMSFEKFDKYLKQNGYRPDKSGDVGVLRYIGSAHIGLVYEDKFISQDNALGGTSIRGLPDNLYRYSLSPEHQDALTIQREHPDVCQRWEELTIISRLSS